MHLVRFVEEELAKRVPDLTVLEASAVLGEMALHYTNEAIKDDGREDKVSDSG